MRGLLIAKTIGAFLILISVIAKAIMDHYWNDKRTKVYRYFRNAFVVTAIAAAFLNIIVLGVDELAKQKSAKADKSHSTEVENLSLGALTPDIYALLYINQKLVCPQRDQHFPGNNSTLDISSQMAIGPQPAILCISVVNSNSFPIYDFNIGLIEETPNPDGTMSVTNLKVLNENPILRASQETMLLCDIPSNIMGKKFEFFVQTRRGNTRHEIAFSRAGDQWLYGSKVVDTTRGKPLSGWFSDNCPKDSNGIPFIRVTTVVKANAPTK
jgi:hypothetical protein